MWELLGTKSDTENSRPSQLETNDDQSQQEYNKSRPTQWVLNRIHPWVDEHIALEITDFLIPCVEPLTRSTSKIEFFVE